MVAVNSIRPMPGGSGSVGQVTNIRSLPAGGADGGTALAQVTIRSVSAPSQAAVAGAEGGLPPARLSAQTVTVVQAVAPAALPLSAQAATAPGRAGEEEEDRTIGGRDDRDEGFGAPLGGTAGIGVEADGPRFGETLSLSQQQTIALLQARDGAVRVEELAHKAAAGAYAGAMRLTYLPGPDGRLYAVGGSVSVSTAGAVGQDAQAMALDAIADGGSVTGATSAADRTASALANGALTDLLLRQTRDDSPRLMA